MPCAGTGVTTTTEFAQRAVEHEMDVLPMAEQSKLPADILAIGNSRVILLKTGAAFLVDAGYKKTLPELERMKAEGRISSVDGIWITHYHDDHTDYVNDVLKTFHAAVYFTKVMSEVIGNPAAFRLPCLTTLPISIDNAEGRWPDAALERVAVHFLEFSGANTISRWSGRATRRRTDLPFCRRLIYAFGYGRLLHAERDFLRKGQGFEFCLRRIASLPRDTWLLNQHVEPMFRYTLQQINRMQNELVKRSSTLSALSPWPDINYMVDESWSRIFPYGAEVKQGETLKLSLRITNHAPRQMVYRVNWNAPAGWKVKNAQKSITIPARSEGEFTPSSVLVSGLHVITADVSFENWQLPRWTEALVRVR